MIRQATPADLPSLLPLAESFTSQDNVRSDLEPEWWLARWTDIIECGRGVVFAEFDGDRAIGAIGGLIYQGLSNSKKQAKEAFWFVAPDRRGGGMGLLGALEDWAREQGADCLWMIRLDGIRERALDRVYARRGYRPVERAFCMEIGT